ncbi:peptidase U32 family protein [Nanoarchaeota archaeon]
MTELLAPVSNWPMLRAAIQSGANAIYFGIKQLNMRITANNFELSELKKIVSECHKNKVKAYLTLNTIVYEDELSKLKKILQEAKKAKIDAIICWDHSVILLCKELKIPFHISTQASVSNSRAAEYYKKLGAKRIVLARECSLEQIKEIKNKVKIEIETFVHGAMCVSVSGRCLTSQFLYGKSANRGDCLQPCRREYSVKDLETGFDLKLKNNFIMSPKDLCALPFLDKLVKVVDSLKIEGRVKPSEYVSTVVSVYREALDKIKKKSFDKKFINSSLKKLKTVFNRDFSSGFFLGKPIDEWTDQYGGKSEEKKQFIGLVKKFYKKIKVAEIIIQTGKLKTDDQIMIEGKTTGVLKQKIKSMEKKHKKIKSGKKGELIAIKLNKEVKTNDKVFLIS